MTVAKDKYGISLQTVKADQTGQMSKLISVFLWHTDHIVGFVILATQIYKLVTKTPLMYATGRIQSNLLSYRDWLES